MKVLFVMEHPGVGSLLPALRGLDAHGHHVQLAYEGVKSIEADREFEALAAECPRVTFGRLPSMGETGAVVFARQLRRGIDYLRYLEPRYRDATKLRARATKRAPSSVVLLARLAQAAGPRGIAALRRGLQFVERCLLPPPQVARYLAEQKPDVLLLAHLLQIASTHADYLRAARRLGIPSVFPIRGWDNLTNKGLLRDAPDLLLVWNEFHAAEAEELHGVPREQIRVTGAFKLDHWFTWQPSRSREEFCAEVGLRADRPIVLYVCSSGFVAPHEVGFVRDWIERLRARGGPFAEAGFLVRPHPLNAAQWADAGLDGPQVRVWPRFGEAPHDEASYSNYFDSIYHSAAVVGINTTAQIESAIVGRPVHTLLADEFRATQGGTLHFRYLQAEEIGHLLVARSFDEHAEQLEESLRGRDDGDRNERFLRRFVRPHGLEVSATELVVEAIEELAARPAPRPARAPLLAPLVRLAVTPLAALAARRAERVRESKDRQATPTRELQRQVTGVMADRAGLPVVAGPWAGDEVGELLYWIPFLRRSQALSSSLRERLFVIRPPGHAAWYAGIGAASIDADELAGDGLLSEAELRGPLRDRVAQAFGFGSRPFRVLAPASVASIRGDLARRHARLKTRHQLLEFAPLQAPALPAGEELPDAFVAVRFDFSQHLPESPGNVDAALSAIAAAAERWPVVLLDAPDSLRNGAGEAGVRFCDGLDRAGVTAVLARAHGFVGSYGPEAYLAALLGRPAVALFAALDEVAEADLGLASSFLGRLPFGSLHAVPVDSERAGADAVALLEEPALTLAGV